MMFGLIWMDGIVNPMPPAIASASKSLSVCMVVGGAVLSQKKGGHAELAPL
jgi:hypothetical protein